MRVLFFLSFIIFSCKPSYQKKIINNTPMYLDTFLIDVNKNIIKYEELEIDSIISSSNIQFMKHPLGVRVHIMDTLNFQTPKIKPEDGSFVMIEYSCEILRHVRQLTYETSLVDTLNFKIGYSKQMKGLNYAIKLLRIGDKAKIIIPSYLGFGMSGYGKSVPPYSTLILNVKLLKIQ